MSDVKTAEVTPEQAAARRAQRPLSEHDAYLRRETVDPGPKSESPSAKKLVETQADVDRFRTETYEAEQAELRKQEQAREAKKIERLRSAAVLVTIEDGGRTYRGALPPLLEQGALEGGAGQHVGRLLASLQVWSFYRLEAAERAALDPEGFEHGPVRRDGRMEPVPVPVEVLHVRGGGEVLGDQVAQIARQLAGLGLLVEES